MVLQAMESKATTVYASELNMSHNPTSSISVLLIEPDDETRLLLTENLANRGYQVTVTLNVADAISRARFGPSFSLILVNQYRASADEAVSIGQRIRTETGMQEQIPVIVMADQYGEELEGQNHCVSPYCYIAYLSHGQQLWDLIDSLCPIQ